MAATLTAILHETPPAPSTLDHEIPPALDWLIKRCLEKTPEERFPGAHDLAQALEAVLNAPAAAAWLSEVEERNPYPGLQAFTEKDAGVFFGREAEAQALWQRIEHRGLLAVIGPSGAGKTSFVRAGVVASKPEGWGAIVCKPGSAPFRSLGQALVPELASDPEALRQLFFFDNPNIALDLLTRWRRAKGEALLVVDQFEELFTLNSKETQEVFASLLARLASEARVHVLLSLRDDFLIRCSEHEPLAPVFESLTPLPALTTDGLRRALVEPAKRLGYAFEDDALVNEMIASVEGVRGALPLLAFAVSHLWESRDREKKLLTRESCDRLGGVAGALAQHAEAVMSRVGPERQAIVREIFRNLVTAQGTRAIVDRDELMSAFPERNDAEEVLRALIEARLLTSYEVEEAEGQSSLHRVEVAHESLLKAWPRLVKWQAQDEEGAVLRDQLKQAAHLWEEKSRTADLLWTGTAYQEFELWRQRYPGQLTAVETDFARAMAERARRRKRILTAIASTVIVSLTGIAIAIGISRIQAVRARDKAEAEARRAEAGKLLALGRAQIDRYPTAAVAYARASLDLADTPEARRLVVEVLWRAPVARILPVNRIADQMGLSTTFEATAFSPDGNWLAMQSIEGGILLFAREGGSPRYLPESAGIKPGGFGFVRDDVLFTRGAGQSRRLLSVPDLREVRSVDPGGVGSLDFSRGGRLVTITKMSRGDKFPRIRSWSLPGGEARTVGMMPEKWSSFDVDMTVSWLAYGRGRSLFVRRIDDSPSSPGRVVGRLGDSMGAVRFLGGGQRIVWLDRTREIRVWSLTGNTPARILGKAGVFGVVAAEPGGTRFAAHEDNASVGLWDLGDPPDLEPVSLKRPDLATGVSAAFASNGPWLATNNDFSVAFWPIGRRSMRTFRRISSLTMSPLAFSPDGRWLASCPIGEPAQLWPLDPSDGGVRVPAPDQACFGLAVDPASQQVLIGTPAGGAVLEPIGEGTIRALQTGWEGKGNDGTMALAFDAHHRRAAACAHDMNPAIKDPKLRVLRVWDLESGQGRTYSLAHLTDDSWQGFEGIRFAADGSLYAAGVGGVTHLVLPTDPDGTVSSETLYAAATANLDLSRDGRQLLVWTNRPSFDGPSDLVVLDLAAHTSRRITTHGDRLRWAAFDPAGRIVVTSDMDGVVRAGPVSGEEPHLLLGHAGVPWAVAVSPDGRWIASVGDEALHLWPMPDVTKPPLHTLPHAELMAKLDALTNLRVVPDKSSSTGWKLDVGTFPGWKDVPTW
jgi:WD40 repeat protein